MLFQICNSKRKLRGFASLTYFNNGASSDPAEICEMLANIFQKPYA